MWGWTSLQNLTRNLSSDSYKENIVIGGHPTSISKAAQHISTTGIRGTQKTKQPPESHRSQHFQHMSGMQPWYTPRCKNNSWYKHGKHFLPNTTAKDGLFELNSYFSTAYWGCGWFEDFFVWNLRSVFCITTQHYCWSPFLEAAPIKSLALITSLRMVFRADPRPSPTDSLVWKLHFVRTTMNYQKYWVYFVPS